MARLSWPLAVRPQCSWLVLNQGIQLDRRAQTIAVAILPVDTNSVTSDGHNLTPRQKEILRLLVTGCDAKTAARELGISIHTINEHLREARRILGVSSSREAARILAQAEAASPNSMGPNKIGMPQLESRSSGPHLLGAKPRLVYVGATLMLIGVAVAAGLLVSVGAAPHRSVESGSSAAANQNPSPYQTRDVSPGRFDQVTVSGPFQVGVIVGQPSHVSLQGPPALLADTVIAIEGGILTIRFREGAKWSWNPGSGINVVVFTPALSSVHVEGAADVEIGGVRGDEFAAATDGSGSIKIRGMRVGTVQLTSAGSGGITAEGTARDATYIVGGSGSIDAMRTESSNATIAINGSGSAFADVSGTANISINGGGHVQVVGGAKCVKLPINSVRVECR